MTFVSWLPRTVFLKFLDGGFASHQGCDFILTFRQKEVDDFAADITGTENEDLALHLFEYLVFCIVMELIEVGFLVVVNICVSGARINTDGLFVSMHVFINFLVT